MASRRARRLPQPAHRSSRVPRSTRHWSPAAGRVAFLEQEAENARTNGTAHRPGPKRLHPPRGGVRPQGRAARAGAVGRVHAAQAANAITVRYAIPDAPKGGGIKAPLDVTVNGKAKKTMTLTSEFAWLYNQYPFTNDPAAGLLHPDWWIAECGCVPAFTDPPPVISTPFRPMHFYDEQRLHLGKTYRAGDKVRLTAPAGTNAAWTVIDLLDSELVGLPHVNLIASNVLLFGADPTGRRDSAAAFDKAIAFAKAKLKVYVPPGTYQVNRHIIVDNVTIEGAGNWYTIIKGKEVALAEPAPDGSVHTGVGFYGKDAADGGSRNVHLSGFTIDGDVRERIDTDQVNGIGGAISDSTIDGLYIRHTKVGLWFDGPMTNTSHQQHRGGPDRRRAQLPHRRDEVGGPQQLHPQHRRRRPGHVVGEDGGRGQRLRPQHDPDADPGQRHRDLRRHRQHRVEQPGGRPAARGQRHPRGFAVRRRAVRRPADDQEQHDGTRGHARPELEPRPRRHLVLRARQEHRRGHPGDRRPLPGQHVQRDHAGLRVGREGPLHHQRRQVQRHPGRRYGHLGGQRPGQGRGVVRERGRPQRRRTRAVGDRELFVNNCGASTGTGPTGRVPPRQPRRQRLLRRPDTEHVAAGLASPRRQT